MSRYQIKKLQNAGFTLVEVMVVILIMSMLLILGNYADFSSKREKARLEEVAVQILALIDQEKTNALLGKTESGQIVRKRKVSLQEGTNTIEFKSEINLASKNETTYEVPPTTKEWSISQLDLSAYNCDILTPATIPATIIFQNDTIQFETPNNTIKHLGILFSRSGQYREIHIDRRSGVTYEREGTDANPCN